MGSFYNDMKKHQKEIYFVTAAVGVFLLIKYVIIFILPFLLAAIYVYSVRKPLFFINKKTKISRGFLAGLFLFILLFVVLLFIWFLGMEGMCRLKSIIPQIGLYKRNFCNMIHLSCNSIEKNLGIKSITVENLILERVNIIINDLEGDLFPKLLGQTFLYGKTIFSAFMFLLVTIIASVLLAQDYDLLVEKLQSFLFFQEILQVSKRLLRMIGGYLKAQIEIMFIISLICFVGFLINDYQYPYLWAIATGFLDMLPFIGTAIILIPLTILQFLMGNEFAALIFLITYIICAVSRELLEPKLVGQKMGILPIGILASVYVGIKVFGVAGVLWGPLYLLTLFELHKRLYS